MAASNLVDPILNDLEVLQYNLKRSHVIDLHRCFRSVKRDLPFLKTFLVWSRMWRNEDVYAGSYNYLRKVDMAYFCSIVEDTLKRYGKQIQSFCSSTLSSESFSDSYGGFMRRVVSKFEKSIKSFRQTIVYVCINLSYDFSSLQLLSSSCWIVMSDDELVDLLDSVLHSLVYLLSGEMIDIKADFFAAFHPHVEVLEDKLTTLKNFMGFAKFFCVEEVEGAGRNLEHLLTHIQFVAMNAARLAYMYYVGYDRFSEVPMKTLSTMTKSLQIQKRNPVDIQIYETYIKVLITCSLQTAKMDKHILRDFSDSLISCLWELLLFSTSFMVSVKAQMQTIYEGLRFFRSILLRKPQDELDGKIVTILREAAIAICSLNLNEANKVHDVGSSSMIRDSPSGDCCAMLVNINRDIQLIKSQIAGSNMIEEGLPSYKIFEEEEFHKTSSRKTSEGRVPTTHEVVVELKDEAEKVIDRVVRGSKNLEIIPIVGMPGLGKTTLAKKVYNNPSIVHHFHIRLWCSVSQVYNKKGLLLQMLLDDVEYSKENEELKNMNEEDLLAKLKQKLKRHRYLVVFDDVWDIGVWNDLKLSFPDEKNCSRILFTSRFSNVASEDEFGMEPHNLRPLNESESWELLHKKVFGKKDCPQALQGLGIEIAKNCKGLPLTIVIIAGILATKHDAWDEVAESFTSTIVYGTKRCKDMVDLSYKHLPHYLKPCLLYFGAFPEDQEIHAKKLVSLWIAEGSVQNTEQKRLEDVAEEYLMELIERNLVMVAKQRSIGGVKACCIHDLLHEFCKAKSKEENFLQVLHGYEELSTFNELPNLERLSIWSEHFRKSKLFCPRTHTLLLFNPIGSSVWISDITSVFCIYKHLRVLDLEQIILRVEVFPMEVESLVELRYLGIGGEMRYIPPSIENLSNLETFIVKSGFYSVSLPDAIWNMTKLRHLYILGWDHSSYLTSGNLENTSVLDNLDTFSTLLVSLDQVENIVGKIPNIRELKIQLSEAEESMGYCNMSPLQSLESLEVSTVSLPPNHVEFSFPMTLKELALKGLLLSWSKIQLIGELPNLEVLKLLNQSFTGERWDLTVGGFVKLRLLSLDGLDVVEWTDTGCDDSFPCLQKLVLAYVFQLERVPRCLERCSLEEILVKQCSDTVKSLVKKIEEEQKRYGYENLKIHID
ncbi:hypothetical protein ACH5RR_028307 [Cinchona calisaya]|uniref:Uncharacterized protein n=1 Tax=Cinchona calisaya TaxID=153742 RepID=A0ABD2YPS2_9GENT